MRRKPCLSSSFGKAAAFADYGSAAALVQTVVAVLVVHLSASFAFGFPARKRRRSARPEACAGAPAEMYRRRHGVSARLQLRIKQEPAQLNERSSRSFFTHSLMPMDGHSGIVQLNFIYSSILRKTMRPGVWPGRGGFAVAQEGASAPSSLLISNPPCHSQWRSRARWRPP